jgi:hypothetical protein
MQTDIHQHFWSDSLVAALAGRRAAPCVRRRDGAWELRLTGEPLCRVAVDDAEIRSAQARGDGLDRVLIAPSCPLGIETLPPDEAEAVLRAYADGLRELPGLFGAWGAAALAYPDPRDVDRLLDDGFLGLCLPAGALATPGALDRAGPLLERLERRRAPLLIHPGPAAGPAAGVPAWWPALTEYVSQMQASWLAWVACGRRSHPRLRVVFAMLAGLAPLQSERLTARGAAAPGPDPLAFYDTSSYGPRAIGAMAGVVGRGQLVFGSDRPVVDPPRCVEPALLVTNPARALG